MSGTIGPKSRHPAHVAARARLIYQRGYKPAEVRVHLLDEGYDVPVRTISNWVHGYSRTINKHHVAYR